MPVVVIDTIKPKNNLTFPIVEDVDVLIKASGARLSEVVANMATADQITALQNAISSKANQSDLNTLSTAVESKADRSDLTAVTAALADKADKSTTTGLQSQIDAIVTPVTQDAEVQNARVGADTTSYTSLKSRLDGEFISHDQEIKNLIMTSLKASVGFNKVGLKLPNTKVKDGKFVYSETTDVFVGKIIGPVTFSAFLADKTFTEWNTADPGIANTCIANYFDKDMNLISRTIRETMSGVTGYRGLTLMGHAANAPEGCVYVAQMFKAGYLDYVAMTDIPYTCITSKTIETVWKQGTTDDIGYTLKPYFAPYTCYDANYAITTDDNRYSTAPFRVLPKGKYKITSGSLRDSYYVEYDANMQPIERKSIRAENGYFMVTVSDETHYLAVSYDNSFSIRPQDFKVEEFNESSGGHNYVTELTSAAIQAAIDAGGIVELLPNAEYICNSTINWYFDKAQVNGNGATLNFSTLPNDNGENDIAINVMMSRTDYAFPLPNLFPRTFNGCIIKKNITQKFDETRYGVGVNCDSSDTDETPNYACMAKFVDCAIYGFRKAVNIGSEAWLTVFDHCDICYSQYGIITRTSSEATNFGEKISIVNSLVGGCEIGLYARHAYSTIQAINTSFDYNYCSMCVDYGGHIVASNCHVETTKDRNYVLWGKTSGQIVVKDSVFYIEAQNYALVGCTEASECKFVLKDNIKEHFYAPNPQLPASAELIESWI